MERPYARVTVTEKGERSLRAGHPWIYDNELTSLPMCENGDVVDVYGIKDRWLGVGFYNGNSRIRVRILSRNSNDRIDESFWQRKVDWCIDYRRTVMGADFDNCRLVFGEADGFPGLTVDRFGDVLVTEVLSLGMEQRKDCVYAELMKLTGCSVIYERCENAIRDKEGLPRRSGFYAGEGSGTVRIRENGLYYDVNYIEGQKTGYFLDQKYNRAAAAKLAQGRRVLDCFTHTGAFALNCAAAGAEKVTAVDVSALALESAKHNAALNGLENIDFVQRDVFELLTELLLTKSREYDYIILDPPAFTKSGSTVDSAYRGYKDINYRAMRLLPRGGYLATCSCSHFMTAELFKKMLREAAADAGVSLRQIEERRQAPDHPILWGVPETEYLKFFLFQVV